MTARRYVAAVLLGAVGAIVGVWLFADVRVDAGPLDVRARLVPAVSGDTSLVVGPLGEARMDTHDGPFRLDVQTEALDRTSVADLVSGAGARSVAPVDRDAVGAAGQRLLALALAAAAAGGALVAGAALRSRRAAVVGAAAGGLLALSAGGLAAVTLDADAWRSPRLQGVLALAPAAAQDLLQRNDELGDRLADLASGLAVLHAQTVEASLDEGAEPTDDLRLLVIADLHLNRAGLDLARRLAEVYEVDAVINLGDDTDWGSAEESRFLADSVGFGTTYVWVRGNHDSRLTQAAVGRAGATVLDGESTSVGTLRVYGIGDPTFTPDKSTAVIDEGETQFKQRWSEETFLPRYREDTEGLDVDVLLVHDAAMVDAFEESDLPPLVLSGHGHRFGIETRGDTVLLAMGSTGGAGLRAFDDPDDVTPLTAGLLTVDRTSGLATTIDLFTLDPYRGDAFSVRRYLVGPPADEGSTSTP